MTTIGATAEVLPPERTIRLAGREYPLVLPSLRDPRLHLAAVIITLQVLGQTSFHFELSIAQILVAVLTSALLDLVITFARRRIVAWPASAMLTGNGVAFVLRVPGTPHGDWWSLHGAWIFAATAAVSLLSKYLVRWRGGHVFNPSNLGLLLCFLALGSTRADPLDLWWARMSPALAFALAVIVCGGLLITRRTAMIGAAAGFWITFAALTGILAASGHCMTARWHIGPICGTSFWYLLVTSPEILVFLFFMITDPRTAPRSARGRVAFGALVALVAALLIAPQRSEFGTKVALLGSLAILCLLRPLVERLVTPPARAVSLRTRPVAAGVSVVLSIAVAAAALVAAGRHARPDDFTRAGVAAAITTRPDVHLAPGAVPPVEITSKGEFANALSRAEAQQAGRDLAADLVITADALRERDSALAATAGDRLWLARIDEQIADARRTDRVGLTIYRFDTMRIAVLKLRASQAQPEIDLEVTGTATHISYRGSRAVSTTRSAVRRIFVLEVVRGHFLVVDDRAPA
jgi:Na+-translocating ferredoxin:NAD+ oxidoreductase RnfD subunit